MASPKISVVMSVYNEPEKWLKESIDSILNQTMTDFELIIVNDNPEKGLNRSLLNEYKAKDSRIVVVENEQNMRLAASLNKGFGLASGQYIARMDSDDKALPNRFEVQYDFMEKHLDCGVCGTWIRLFGDSINLFSAKIKKLPVLNKEIKTGFLFYNPMVHPSVFFRKSAIEKMLPLYDSACKSAQDYLLWEKLLDNGIMIANIPAVLLDYRMSKDQISNKLKGNQNMVANALRLRALNRMGVVLSEEEKALYNKIFNEEALSGFELFQQIEWLLLKIKGDLSKNDTIDVSFLDKILHSLWVSCFLNLKEKKGVWTCFYKSPLFRTRFLTSREMVKIILSIFERWITLLII